MIDDFLSFLEEWLGLHLTEELYVLDLLSFAYPVSATAVQSTQILPAKPVACNEECLKGANKQ
ncbi:MAG: hypothetical protein Q8L97_03875 [Nitrosomonas sp.]|uniref:hypothetical protein n=1 Tax=Nitrosomonas sp. TaxID=42353 RepID=UPI00272F1BB9|nr:hypothetical protein [Nitrosomonas sp.]MDP1549285.1 hypothetical protein [Nitrosomonas sp.]